MKTRLLYLVVFVILASLSVITHLPQSALNHDLCLSDAIAADADLNTISAPVPITARPRPNAVTEPSTLALISTGLAGGAGIYLFLKIKRRKK
jgi:hypothetical protein